MQRSGKEVKVKVKIFKQGSRVRPDLRSVLVRLFFEVVVIVTRSQGHGKSTWVLGVC